MAKTNKNKENKVQEPILSEDFKLSWAEMSNEQREATIIRSFSAIIAKTAKETREKGEKPFWNKSQSVEQMDNTAPFNGADGQVYENSMSVILRAVSQLNGYENPVFLTMKEGNLMGGKLKRDNEGKIAVKGVKVPYMKRVDYIEAKDDLGQTILKDNGKPQLVAVQLAKPMIETSTLYHISQFEGLDHSKLKERNLDRLNKKRDYFKENPDKLQDRQEFVQKFGLSQNIVQNLYNFVQANKGGKDFVAPPISRPYDAKAKEQQNIKNNTNELTAKKNTVQGLNKNNDPKFNGRFSM